MTNLMTKLFLFLFLSINLFAKVTIIGNYKTFDVVSKKKQIEYYLLLPKRKIKLKLPNYSEIYIRALPDDSGIKSYYFKLIYNGYEKTYKKKLKISKSVKGIKNEKISVLSKITPKSENLVIQNISDIPILIRIREKYKNIKFIPISPSIYKKAINLSIKGKNYPYYMANKEIALQIEGEAYLKIISRTLKKNDYSYSIYDNKKIIAYEKFKYVKSRFLKNISKGNVRIYKIQKGKHNIKIQTDDYVIFRFFINNGAVRLVK